MVLFNLGQISDEISLVRRYPFCLLENLPTKEESRENEDPAIMSVFCSNRAEESGNPEGRRLTSGTRTKRTVHPSIPSKTPYNRPQRS